MVTSRGRLAAAGGADQGHRLAFADREADAADHLALLVGEVDVAEFDALPEVVEVGGVGPVLDGRLGVEQGEDAFTGRDALVDRGERIGEETHRAGDLGEDAQEGEEAAAVELALGDEHAAEDQQTGGRRDAEELAHRRGQLLAVGNAARGVGELAVDRAEPFGEEALGVVALDDLHAGERFVEHGRQFAEGLLYLLGRAAQPFDDGADQQGNDGQVDHRKDRELERHHEHGHHVADDEERFAEDDLQCVGDAELDDLHVGHDARHDVALAFVAEEADVHAQDVFVDLVADPVEGIDAHVLDDALGQVAEQVAEKGGSDDDAGQQNHHVVEREVITEDAVHHVAQRVIQKLGGKTEPGKFGDGRQHALLLEEGIDDRHDQRKGEGVEKGVQQRAEEVGYGESPDRCRELQKPPVCFHLVVSVCVRWSKSRKNSSHLVFLPYFCGKRKQ